MTPLQGLLAQLARRASYGAVLGLERVTSALSRLGEPHRVPSTIHVAGTNGKGSTAAMVEALLREAGLTTGLTTSPHLVRFAERIQLSGAPIGDAPFAAALERVLGVPEELTFFESLTVAAFVAFEAAGVDVAVLETGLGGRLDATNVCLPVATAVTSIALDHQAFLGLTVEDIALEKAGIAKLGVPMFVGRAPASAGRALVARCAELGAAPILELGRDLCLVEGDPPQVALASWSGRDPLSVPLRLSLEGRHQLDNAALAVALARSVLSDEQLTRAAPALGRVEWPGRLERRSHRGRHVVLDGAHNEDGAAALARALEAAGERGVTLLFGAMDDKPVEAMLAALVPHASLAVLTEPVLDGGSGERASRRSATVRRLVAACGDVPVVSAPEPRLALEEAIDGTPPEGTLVVCGSLYLVGCVRAALLGVTPDPALGL